MSRPRKLRSKKAGLPPGSLVHIGDIKSGAAEFLRFDFDAGGCVETHFADTAGLEAAPAPFGNAWINVCGLRDPAELAALGKRYGLHPLVQEDILNNVQRQKIDAYDDYLYLVLHHYELQAGSSELAHDQISLVIGHRQVLSFEERPTKLFDPVRQRLRNEHGSLRKGGADMLAYSLIDVIVDSYFAVIEQLSERAEQLEADVLGRTRPATLEGIHQFKRCVSQLRRNLYPLREVLGSLHRDAGDFFAADIQLYLRDVYDHTVHILESLEDLRDQATGLLDVYLSTVSHRVNLEVRALTVVATIFMPATLIAGIFGMNFHVMPWLDDAAGFRYATGAMAAIAVVMLLLFWRRRYV